MADIYALQTATMVGCALEGTAEWFCNFHSPHKTNHSAISMAHDELEVIRDADLVDMQANYPQDQYNEADYAIRVAGVTELSSILELVRRNGTDSVALAQMVITKSPIFETSS